MKKIIIIAVMGLSALGITNSTVYAQETVAQPSSHQVKLDGEVVDLTAFNIGGNNFFMLRDVAYVLSGTSAQFEVTWDAELWAINLMTGYAYTPTGGEMTQGAAQHTTAIPTTAAVYIDGVRANLRAYNIGGNNFFMLRDLGDALGFDVGWDEGAGAVLISSGIHPLFEELEQEAVPIHIWEAEFQRQLEIHLLPMIPVGRPAISPNQGMPSSSQIADWSHNFTPTEFETAVFSAINQVRLENGRTTLPWSHSLASAAALRTAYLAESDFSDFGGGTVHHWGSFTTENLHRAIPTRGSWWAVTFTNRSEHVINNVNTTVDDIAQSVIDGWINSQVHRDRLLSRHNYEVGVGSAINPHTGAIFIYAFFDASGR